MLTRLYYYFYPPKAETPEEKLPNYLVAEETFSDDFATGDTALPSAADHTQDIPSFNITTAAKSFLASPGSHLKNGLGKIGAGLNYAATTSTNWAFGKIADAVIEKATTSIKKTDVSTIIELSSTVVGQLADGMSQGVAKGLNEIGEKARDSVNGAVQEVQVSIDQFAKDVQKSLFSNLEQGLINLLVTPLKWLIGLLDSLSDSLNPAGQNPSQPSPVIDRMPPPLQSINNIRNWNAPMPSANRSNQKELDDALGNISTPVMGTFDHDAASAPEAEETLDMGLRR